MEVKLAVILQESPTILTVSVEVVPALYILGETTKKPLKNKDK